MVLLLQPTARFFKHVVGAGPWQVRRSDEGQPFFCLVLEGGCRLTLDGCEAQALEAGDFVLVPATFGVEMSSLEPAAGVGNSVPTALGAGEFRIGSQDAPPDLRLLAGHCSFGSADSALLVSLLPQMVHVRGQARLATLVQLVSDESRSDRPARDVMLGRMLEVLLIEALRSTTGIGAPRGLVAGLADLRLAAAIRAMHAHPSRPWTVDALAREAALSRTSFFERFQRTVGSTPMHYLLAWRMALAKSLLQRENVTVAEISQRVGYSSASAFSVAFTRHVGLPPSDYAREAAAPWQRVQ